MPFYTAFILGLVGSLHCAGMCGPLALALPATGSTRLTYLGGRAAYNLGRIVTYCLLGLVFGLLGRTLALAGVQRWTSIALGVTLLAGLFSSRKLVLWSPVAALVENLKCRMSALLRRRFLSSLALLGFLNGLLPCGLVYAACAGAVTTSGTLAGAQYMAAFGLGTVPMMLAISLSGKLVPLGLRLQLRKAIPVSVFLLATLLILRGLSLGIPCLSPDLSAGASCCHLFNQETANTSNQR
jgi:sulfite exporter TauE/SafE